MKKKTHRTKLALHRETLQCLNLQAVHGGRALALETQNTILCCEDVAPAKPAGFALETENTVLCCDAR